MTRRSTRATLVALALVPAMFVSACGDSTPAPEKTPVAPAPTVDPVVAEPATPVKAAEPAAPVEPAAPAPVVEEPKAAPQPQPERSAAAETVIDQLGPLRDAVAGLGIELSDEDLAQVATYVDGAVTEESVTKALQHFGADNPGSAATAIADSVGVDVSDIPGMGGSDASDAADAVKKQLPKGLGGDADDVTKGDGAKKAVAGLSVDQLKAERKAAVTALEVEMEKELVALRAKFAERTKRKPAKAAELAATLSTKETALTADYAAKIEATKADFKKRIQDAR